MLKISVKGVFFGFAQQLGYLRYHSVAGKVNRNAISQVLVECNFC